MKAHDNLGLTLDALGRFDDAVRAYQKAIELNEQLPKKSKWPYYNLGELLFKHNQITQSIPCYQKALMLDEGWAQARVALGKALLKDGKEQQALAEFQTASRLDPQYSEAHYQLGQLLRRLGLVEAAREELRLFEASRKKRSSTAPVSE